MLGVVNLKLERLRYLIRMSKDLQVLSLRKYEYVARAINAGLRLHATKCQVMRTRDGIDFLGYRIFPTHRRLRQTTARRFMRRLRVQSKRYAMGLLCWQGLDQSIQSWLGHAAHAATYGLRRSVFSAIAFRRMPVLSPGSTGEGQAVPGRPARRRVEQ